MVSAGSRQTFQCLLMLQVTHSSEPPAKNIGQEGTSLTHDKQAQNKLTKLKI